MYKRVKKRWVAALRSGKYMQVSHQLRRGDGFCCLGVLCDLHSKSKSSTRSKWTPYNSYKGRSVDLPAVVCKWAGIELKDKNDNCVPITFSDEPRYLTWLNDQQHCSFEEIAEAIEKQL